MLGIYLRPKMLRGQSGCLTEALVSVEDAGIWWAAEDTPCLCSHGIGSYEARSRMVVDTAHAD